MTYWQGNDTSVRTDTERGRPRKLTLENDFLLSWFGLKLDFSWKILLIDSTCLVQISSKYSILGQDS